MLPAPTIINQVFKKHKDTWTDEEKRMLHKKLNKHGIGDGIDAEDQAINDILCMVYIDGIRDGRR